jgi:hypothetical protein
MFRHENPVAGDARPREKHIALVAVDHLDRDALCYVLNACQRMDARLDLLTGLPPQEIDRSVAAARAGKDTPWRLVALAGGGREVVDRYAKNQPGLLFLASGGSDRSARRLRNDFDLQGMRPGIPWVVVENKPKRP